jgi:hypothetical protein
MIGLTRCRCKDTVHFLFSSFFCVVNLSVLVHSHFVVFFYTRRWQACWRSAPHFAGSLATLTASLPPPSPPAPKLALEKGSARGDIREGMTH